MTNLGKSIFYLQQSIRHEHYCDKELMQALDILAKKHNEYKPLIAATDFVYDLRFCEKCFQMTNHLDGVCQKCKDKSTPVITSNTCTCTSNRESQRINDKDICTVCNKPIL